MPPEIVALAWIQLGRPAMFFFASPCAETSGARLTFLEQHEALLSDMDGVWGVPRGKVMPKNVFSCIFSFVCFHLFNLSI